MRTKNQISQTASVSKKGGNTNINQNKIIIEMPKPVQRRQYKPRKKSIAEAEQELQNLENQDAGYSMGNPINVSVVQPPTINPSVFGYSHLPVGTHTEVIPAPPEYNPPPEEPITEARGKRKGRPIGSKNRARQAIQAEAVASGLAKAEGYYTDVGGFSPRYTENPLLFEKIYGQGFNQGGYRSDFEERRIQQARQDYEESGGGKAGSSGEYVQSPNDLLLAKLKAKREASVTKTPRLNYSSGSEFEINLPPKVYKPVKKKNKAPTKLIIEDEIPPPTLAAEPTLAGETVFIKPAAPELTKEQRKAEKEAKKSQIEQKKALRGLAFNA